MFFFRNDELMFKIIEKLIYLARSKENLDEITFDRDDPNIHIV